jgi:hypothetical protein
MDRRINGLGGAMREIALARDTRLRKSGAISPERAEQLRALLATEFPVETALNAAAHQRDESLSAAEPALPLAVQTALMERVRFAGATTSPFDVFRRFLAWLEALSLRRAYRTAALGAAAVILTAAAAYFARSNTGVDRIDNRTHGISIADQGPAFLPPDHLFQHSSDPLPLRVSRRELAALAPSFLTINRHLPDLEQADRVELLDLPSRQIRLDVNALRAP